MTVDPARLTANWPFPTAVRFGSGRLAELGRACARLGFKRPLIVTDAGLAVSTIVAAARASLAQAGLDAEVFSEVKSNPSAANVAAGAAAYSDGGRDAIVAIGGGSAMDAAKGIALQAGHPAPVLDYAVGAIRYRDIDGTAIAPLVAVPTTSGTGSEMGYAAVISDEDAAAKRILYHSNLLARTVICDPDLTVGLPANLTAWTGMDAAVHCIEAYCAHTYNPLCDGIAAEGLRLIATWLPRAVANGGDLEARTQMMAAAAMGAVAFNKGLGAVHAISHAIGARFDTHHGLTNAVVLPYVLHHNRAAVADRCAVLARCMGLPAADFDGLMDWTLAIREIFSIPHALDGLGVGEGDLDALAETAAADVTARENPVPVNTAALKGIMARALSGALG
ncbi:MAG: alcohol dehydrogenase [Rhodospirillales bacterium CG15_BIG_FIL_POST_REV_8_21_14_020_66_15]|nr:MAG: alcohol dehydrogenase [Rhodospirillales bacterium CG15_BIG_FIL_POST_REV_8_21_14_020_66_15]